MLELLKYIDAHGYVTFHDFDRVRATIAKATGMSLPNVRATVNRYSNRFVQTVPGRGGAGLRGVWARRYPDSPSRASNSGPPSAWDDEIDEVIRS